MPGGGVGLMDACTTQHSKTWGANEGGIGSAEQCNELPDALKPGCDWRFDWFKNANNPKVSYKSIECPQELVDKTGCRKA
jgi:hypothetical protein